METQSLVVAATTAPPPPPTRQKIKHEIFLAHSGKQKGFATDLAARLFSLGYTVFFDENDDSLPLGEAFPTHIFSAENSCKLGIVALSEDFLTSPWPLMELCSFMDRLASKSPSFTILPLFFMVSPADLKIEENVKKWRQKWESLERKNRRRDAKKCEEAVTKVLPCLNGVVWSREPKQGECSYIDDIIKRIFDTLPPLNLYRFRYGVDPNKQYVGVQRLCQVILDKFRELAHPCILGMYGVAGSGKSTLCNFLCNSMFDEFMGKVIHLELPTELRGDDDHRIKEQYVKLFSTMSPQTKDTFASMDLVQMYNLLLTIGTRFSHKMFLVLDNISPSNYESYAKIVNAILRSGVLDSGSRVMVVAQSSATLENLLLSDTHQRFTIIEVPCLTEDEAMEIIRHWHPSVTKDVIRSLLYKCSFRTSSFMYVPFVFEQIGILLKNNCRNDVKELELFWRMVEEGKKKAIKKLVQINFTQLREDLQVLLFDIALFIIPVGYSKLTDATPILCRLHDMTDVDAFKLEWKMKELMQHCALSLIDEELRVHDIYVEYSRSIPRNSKSYVDVPSMNTWNALVTNGQKYFLRTIPIRLQLNYSEARTVYIGSLKGSPHCCHYDEEVCLHVKEGARAQAVEVLLDVEVGATTAALFVTNPCPSYKCILGLSGDFTSLVCIRTKNVRLAAFSPCGCNGDLRKLLRIELNNEGVEDIRVRKFSSRKWDQLTNFIDFISNQFQNTTQSMRWLWKPFIQYEQCRKSNAQSLSKFLLSKRMSQLRVLILINAGIRRLENIGRHCPQLEILEILDDMQYVMEIKVDEAPKLKRLVAGEDRKICGGPISPSLHWHYCASSGIYYYYLTKVGPRNSRRLTLNFCVCPALEELYVDGSFDQVKIMGLLPSSLKHVALEGLQSMSGELVSSSLYQLSLLETLYLICKKVETLNFTRPCLGRLPCLKVMVVDCCESLTHLSVETGCIPNLVTMCVSDCDKLQAFEGLQDILMKQLEGLALLSLPQLQVVDDVLGGSSLEARAATNSNNYLHLQNISVERCPGVKIDWSSLQDSQGILSWMWLKELSLWRIESNEHRHAENFADVRKALFTSSRAVLLTQLTFSEGRLTLLTHPYLIRVSHVREIVGFQNLPTLQYLSLGRLPDLAHVSGMWPRSIVSITFDKCPMLLRIPPLQQTPEIMSFYCQECARLKGVEGRFGEMKELCSVEFVECESMEVFPLEGVIEKLAKRKETYSEGEEWRWTPRLRVYGSKFATVELMQEWLRSAEFGSPLWKAAMEGLMWEHVDKGTLTALHAFRQCLSAVFDDMMEVDRQHLQRLIFPSDRGDDSFRYFFTRHCSRGRVEYHKKPEVKLFQEWLLCTFPQLTIYHKHKENQLYI